MSEKKILPHGPLTKLEDGLWRVEGSLSGMPLHRVMTVAKLASGDLVVHNAMMLADPAMKELDALGTVAYVIVPNAFHRLDAPAYKDRYPKAKFVCPKGARAKVEKVVPVDLVYEEFPKDARVALRTLKGVKDAEGVMIVTTEGGTTLTFNDALFNMPHAPGFQGFIVKNVMGSSGGFKVTRLFRTMMLKDKAAFRADLEELAKTPTLKRIIVSHHETLEGDVAGELMRVAQTV